MATQQKQKKNSPSKDVTISNVWANTDFTRARKRVLLAEEPKDLLIAINCYAPGSRNEMHFHVGTGQSFLVLKGTAEVKHRHKDLHYSHHSHLLNCLLPEKNVVSTLHEGDCVLIPANVYYQIDNPGPDQLVLYQAKQPGELVSVEGKGILNPGDYYTTKREAEADLNGFGQKS